MFTGIVEETGKIDKVLKNSSCCKININCRKVLDGTKNGDSIAVNGVCLTVTNLSNIGFEADISYETIERTSLKNITGGETVNLERALTLSSRLGGHLVQGHVDAVATVASIAKKGNSYILKINYPEYLDKYITEKCSVALDGISLTVASVSFCCLEVAVIPHTFANTNLSFKKSGDKINIEIDQIARYTEKLLKNKDKDDKLVYLIMGMKKESL
ncbi:MAG: riboflavin synthase [Deferribacterales bacterium]|nr:riboflavin synthase [Deferribacterales bacterium]